MSASDALSDSAAAPEAARAAVCGLARPPPAPPAPAPPASLKDAAAAAAFRAASRTSRALAAAGGGHARGRRPVSGLPPGGNAGRARAAHRVRGMRACRPARCSHPTSPVRDRLPSICIICVAVAPHVEPAAQTLPRRWPRAACGGPRRRPERIVQARRRQGGPAQDEACGRPARAPRSVAHSREQGHHEQHARYPREPRHERRHVRGPCTRPRSRVAMADAAPRQAAVGDGNAPEADRPSAETPKTNAEGFEIVSETLQFKRYVRVADRLVKSSPDRARRRSSARRGARRCCARTGTGRACCSQRPPAH